MVDQAPSGHVANVRARAQWNRWTTRKVTRTCVALAVLVGLAVPNPASANPENEPNVQITQRGTVQFHAADLPVDAALELLSLESGRNIVASPAVTGRITAHIRDATFEEVLEAILMPVGAGFRVVDNFTFVHTSEELAAMERAKDPLITRVFRLDYISGADATAYIAPLLGEDGNSVASPAPEKGLSSGADEAGSNANANQDCLVVTARQGTMEVIEGVLAELDICPKQVLIEATILRAALTDDNALGIDFSLVGGVDLETLGATSPAVADIALGLLPTERLERFNASAATTFTEDVPSGGITIGIVKDKVAVFLRALEQVTDTYVLANPKVLALNKQKAQVIVGRRDGYLTTTVTETQSIQSVEFLETGTQLIFRPFIGKDGRVRVELHPEDSVGFVSAQGLPSEQTTEVTTNVLVRDGETILIGGLFRELTTASRGQVPWLGNLPVIGALFRSRSDSTSREEVIVLLTVHIVKDDGLFAAASARQLENIERMRVGLRRGLMWHGRERIAQSHYAKALQAHGAGDYDKAVYHVNMALHASERMMPAIEFKERLLGERAWDYAGTASRTFLHELIQRERGYDTPFFGRPPAPSGRAGGPEAGGDDQKTDPDS